MVRGVNLILFIVCFVCLHRIAQAYVQLQLRNTLSLRKRQCSKPAAEWRSPLSRAYALGSNAFGTRTSLQMSIYSSDKGVPAALVEERDACGVGFIARLNNQADHEVVQQALAGLSCMEHRGATSSDNISGDGAGVMTAIPWDIFSGLCDPSASLNHDGSTACAVGMIFLPQEKELFNPTVEMIETTLTERGFKFKWRDVPTDTKALGELSKEFVPIIKQIILDSPTQNTSNDLEVLLYDVRRQIMGQFRQLKSTNAYVCSMSSKTIVYKGMLRSKDLQVFYKDLTDPKYKSAFAIYHRRFSTNTVPKWFLAQPMRLLAHNGEINTLLGNINWVKSRQYALQEGVDKDSFNRRVRGPLTDVSRSDSANLDSVLESYMKSGPGRSPQEALMMLVPEAYESQPTMKNTPAVRAFYSYYESLQEAWDGPALLVFSDGDVVGAALDRNGLRPARYMLTATKDGQETVHVMSEVGVTKVVEQFATEGVIGNGQVLVDAGRLGPGQMLSVDLKAGKYLLNDELKQSVASQRPYEEWEKKSITALKSSYTFQSEVDSFKKMYVPSSMTGPIDPAFTGPVTSEVDNENLLTKQTLFGWGTEDVEVQIHSMASEGIEATFCMGDDAPLAALSTMPHVLYDYFKQRFAQVTNPPIDSLREGAVMSLTMFLGPRGEPLSFTGQSDIRVRISSPILNADEMAAISSTSGVRMKTLTTQYPITDALTVGGLETALKKLTDAAVDAVKQGATIINLSDKADNYKGMTYVSPLLAVGAVHHRLIEAGLRTKASIVVTTGQAWSTHHFACLVGYGASAVVPYAAYDAVINWHSQKRNQLAMERGDLKKISASQAIANFRKAADKGLLKILSKMGISLLTSYHGSQIFESIGLADDVLLKAFKGTPSRVGGLTFDEIAAETIEFSRKAFGDAQFAGIAEKIEKEVDSETKSKKLFNYGFLNFFKSGEYHHNNQPLIKQLHQAIRTNDLDLYNLYEQSVKSRPPTTLRDVMEFVPAAQSGRTPVPLEQVESADSIMRRFCTGGMSLGALSREAHETLAVSLNRIGGKSNSGEGGEDPVRMHEIRDVNGEGESPTFPHLKGLQNGDTASSKIKQIASGRFGVTPQYLMSAEQLEIKVAQGAKPGEGGQLPGAKIDEYIANLRKSKPGVTLISPPPHHDIYSIEDLAQLIYDLHQINPAAGVSVKLVSEVGIGTIASGVTKAGADVIQISGHDGGTGASPVSSIKHAGSPWELGLVEVHNTLLNNKLRERVLLRVDGGLKSGWDVVMAAAMGGEEFGFGTIAMIAEGCIMARICHTNKCPVGITTQNEALRKRFPGTPDNVVTYFGYVAEEVRHILAELGFKSIEEMIGLPGVIRPRQDLVLKKTGKVDVSYIMDNLMCTPVKGDNLCEPSELRAWLKHGPVFSNGFTFDDAILKDTDVSHAINAQKSAKKTYKITNVDRSSFARVSGVIAKKYGDSNFQGRLQFDLTGAAGQSFCAFLSKGMDVTLRGYANDYVCKGMAGGKVVISPPTSDDAACEGSGRGRGAEQHSVVGNTVLYGSTGGSLFVRGRGGERFAVRNSGALGIVEGLGDHACEYMTAGTILCLGSTGRNFGAGMTGGLAFVLDDDNWLDGKSTSDGISLRNGLTFKDFVNSETVTLLPMSSAYKAAKARVIELLTLHIDETGSKRAKRVLENIDEALTKMTVLVPASEKSSPLLVKEEVGVGAVAVKA